MPKLSICVPSRNRQYYFQHTIAALLESPRTDVEFVFADNSDDPSIMNNYMASISDARVTFLPSSDAALSMVDNWERMVAASTGEWVTVVGDDDYADPEANPRTVVKFPGVKTACDEYFGSPSPVEVLVGEGDLAYGRYLRPRS